MEIHSSWSELFSKFSIDLSKICNDIVYPPKEMVYKVFTMDPREIKVVLLGQDPYHKEGQAHGLSFSVPSGVTIPPSLRNIFREIQHNFPERGYVFKTGNLDRWFTEEKIFLLNASLTVVHNKPGSHMKIWEAFTNEVIKYISDVNPNCIFLLLGNFAKEKSKMITDKSRIISGTHPSPLAQTSAVPFLGSGIFKKVEFQLNKEINWSVS
jgi:uracil-DNA glycosylase